MKKEKKRKHVGEHNMTSASAAITLTLLSSFNVHPLIIVIRKEKETVHHRPIIQDCSWTS